MKKIFSVLALLFCLNLAYSQDKIEITAEDYENNAVEMADTMRSNGKIYVVVAVVMVVFAGIIFYMIQTERKITRIEREVLKEKGNS